MRGLPSYGIDGSPHEVEGVVLLGDFVYCLKCGGWWARGLSAATWRRGFWLSSVGVLLEGLRLPSVVMRPGWRGGGLVARLWASLRLC